MIGRHFLRIFVFFGFVSCGGSASNPADVPPGTDLGTNDSVGGGDGGSGPDSSSAPGTCGFPAAGGAGAVTVVPDSSPRVVQQVDSVSQNTIDDRGSPLPGHPRGVLRRGPCGTVGLLFRQVDPANASQNALAYLNVSAKDSTPEAFVKPFSGLDATLFFDTGCTPLAVLTGDKGFVEYLRGTDGTWTPHDIGPDLTGTAWSGTTSLALFKGHEDASGRLRLIGYASGGEKRLIAVGTRDPAPGSSWTFQALPEPAGATIQDAAVDASGTLHAVYTRTVFPCDPCNLDLYYGKLPPGGSWSEEVLQDSKWGEPNDEYATDASLVVDASGRPFVAATYLTRVITGSIVSADLRIYGPETKGWCSEKAVTQVDGYHGEDGTGFTGATPRIALDSAGRIFVVFGDLSQWHDKNGWSNGVQGQLRLAIRSGGTWHVSTLRKQTGHVGSPKPLQGFSAPMLAVSPDGTEVFAAGVERIWETDSIYNNDAVPIQYNALVIRAGVTLP